MPLITGMLHYIDAIIDYRSIFCNYIYIYIHT